ncbi:MAG: universal stress protein [Dysgonamonadaceae bacterium]|jgi:nucleotide-binding universal stress UspA family protein|nr:universal stress protein [Dysgonamonadaceae bacterium]
MEDKLITLAIHTYQKAQIIKTLLESEGIEVYLHNVNLISPMVSSGVRVRIKESDLPAALKFIENTTIFNDESDEEKEKTRQSKKILIPIDFSDYSLHACEIGFNYAKEIDAEVIIIHAHFTPYFPPAIPLNDTFSYPAIVTDEENIALLNKTKEDLKNFSHFIEEKIQSGEWANVPFSTVFCEGLPEEEIVSYSHKHHVSLIIMGTRGKDQKDIDLIGSVTAEVIEMTKVPVFAIPENTPFRNFSGIKKIALGTSFEQNDFIAFDTLFKMFRNYGVEYCLFHITHKQNTWNEIKLAGIKEYFAKQYPGIKIQYDILDAHDFILDLEKFVRNNKIDIIAIPTYKRNLFARMFNPSVARKMLFHTDTPLLTLRY